ncbi:hypothetical protein GCM10009122_14410 [Fulvivirga kasyanovii]|uniref:KTSC domain-containing protein n=1 Tax=Fulvivirga kasyanovii TaxID=396812 RepID=A0ABW9RKN0_9BACT|nr:hypothetical protein [Fulvivirga kasyanovii]MTI24583.1 hypothetical protein [Fulvivirga kasyanovii]
MDTQVTSFSFKREKVYVDLDVRKTNWKVSIMGEHLTHKTFSQDPNPDILYEYLVSHYAFQKVFWNILK